MFVTKRKTDLYQIQDGELLWDEATTIEHCEKLISHKFLQACEGKYISALYNLITFHNLN